MNEDGRKGQVPFFVDTKKSGQSPTVAPTNDELPLPTYDLHNITLVFS